MIIDLSEISFSYDEIPVLDKISLRVDRGEFLIILGTNGAGKTTLIRLVLGEIKPGSGRIELFDTPINSFSSWTKIGYLKQNGTEKAASFPSTVYELVASNLYSKLGLIKFLRREHKMKVDEVLDQVGMKAFRNRLFSKLSGGQMQKVMLARCLIGEPELLILDEPTSSLDDRAATSLFEVLKKISAERGTTIIVASHDKARAEMYGDRVLRIDDQGLKVEAI